MAYSIEKLGPLSKKPVFFLIGGFIAVTIFFTLLFSIREQEKLKEIKENGQDHNIQSLQANLSKADKLGIFETDLTVNSDRNNKKAVKRKQVLSKVSAKTTDDEDFAKNYVLYQEKHALTDRVLKDDSQRSDKFVTRTVSFDDYAGPPKDTEAKETAPVNTRHKKTSAVYEQALKAPSKVNLEFRHDSSLKSDNVSYVDGKKEFNQPDLRSLDTQDGGNDNGRNTENTLESYDSLKRNDYILKNEVENPKTPFALMQGSVIHATLLNGINSELPGQITAQISRDVHDSIRAKYLLIPRGSKLVGQYASGAAFGTERLFIGFNRIIFPNGQSVNLGSMPGQTTGGYSGFDANVDNHYFKIIANSLLLSSISTASDHYKDTYNLADGRQRTVAGFKAQGSSNISQALSKIIEKNVNLSPTLTVESGYPFTVAITKDIFFKSPYGSENYGHFKR